MTEGIVMKQRTLEEEWEYYKELEREGINPFEYAGEPCKDCTKCISVCEKRKSADTTVVVRLRPRSQIKEQKDRLLDS